MINHLFCMYYESFIFINIILHQAFELVTGDSLFEPKAGQNFSLEEGKPFKCHPQYFY